MERRSMAFVRMQQDQLCAICRMLAGGGGGHDQITVMTEVCQSRWVDREN
jgi:hypothetical protein